MSKVTNFGDSADLMLLDATVALTGSSDLDLTNFIPGKDYDRIWVIVTLSAASSLTATIQGQEAATDGGSVTNIGTAVTIDAAGESVVLDLRVSHADKFINVNITGSGTSGTAHVVALGVGRQYTDAYAAVPVSPATAVVEGTYGPFA